MQSKLQMFSLIKSVEDSKGLSLVEDLVNISSEQKYTHIQYDINGKTYIGIIGQPPEYFTYLGYIKYLQDKLTSFKFIDGHAVYDIVKIPMVLQIKPVSIEDLKSEIAELKAIIARFPQPDELIETHIYPSWETYEEFKQLTCWKYFEASENSGSYFMIITNSWHQEDSVLRDKYKDRYVQVQYRAESTYYIISESPPTSKNNHTSISTMNRYINYSYKGKGLSWSTKENHMASIDYNYYIIYHKDDQLPARPLLFHKNIKTYYFENDFTIATPLRYYINNLLIGWFLLNWQKYIEHEIYLTIDITNEVKIKFYKKQSRSIKLSNNIIKITLPTIKSVEINGVEYY